MADTTEVLNDLLETLEDGHRGYREGAEKLSDSSRPEVATTFEQMATQRQEFAAELRTAADAHGLEVEQHGSTVAALHRGWLSLRDAISGDDPDGVLKAALQGENHAVSEYEDAQQADLPSDIDLIVRRQAGQIDQARNRIEALVNDIS